MSRPLRIQYPGAVHHVMNRGRARQPTFIDGADDPAFLDTVAQAQRLWGIEVFAYSLMGNHYHLCVRIPRGNLSRVMRHVDGISTQRFHRRDGMLFRPLSGSPRSCKGFRGAIPKFITTAITRSAICFTGGTRPLRQQSLIAVTDKFNFSLIAKPPLTRRGRSSLVGYLEVYSLAGFEVSHDNTSTPGALGFNIWAGRRLYNGGFDGDVTRSTSRSDLGRWSRLESQATPAITAAPRGSHPTPVPA
jgi:REP element-mobilizing transposase RayT